MIALGGVVACALALPLAMASAGPVGDDGRSVVRALVPFDLKDDGGTGADPKAPTAVPPTSRTPSHRALELGLGLATAVRCGPELTSPEGVEAQTCVLTQGEDTWARTYYRNATGRALEAVLSLMGPEGRTVQMRCAVAAEDEPATCETPRERTRGTLDAYTAVSEFAREAGNSPLLLRSGSNSAPAEGD